MKFVLQKKHEKNTREQVTLATVTKRSKLRKPKPTSSIECLVIKQEFHFGKSISVVATSAESMAQRFCPVGDAVHKNKKVQSSSKRNWFYLEQSTEKANPKINVERKEEFFLFVCLFFDYKIRRVWKLCANNNLKCGPKSYQRRLGIENLWRPFAWSRPILKSSFKSTLQRISELFPRELLKIRGQSVSN